jgi:hypothetical protein
MRLFEIHMTDRTEHAWWFEAKQKYKVRIDAETKEGSCDCHGDTFRKSGRKQSECKHIQAAKAILKSIGKGKDAQKKV